MELREIAGTLPDAGRINVADAERVASGVVGGIAALSGLRRGGLAGALLALAGAALVHRGVTGHCMVYERLGMDTAHAGGVVGDVPSPTEDEVAEELHVRPEPEATTAWDRVDEASMESFPASDPPAFWQGPRGSEH